MEPAPASVPVPVPAPEAEVTAPAAAATAAAEAKAPTQAWKPLSTPAPWELSKSAGHIWYTYGPRETPTLVGAYGAVTYTPHTGVWMLRATDLITVFRYERGVPECGIRPTMQWFDIVHRAIFSGDVFLSARGKLDLTGMINEANIRDKVQPADLVRLAKRNTIAGMTAAMAEAVSAAVANAANNGNGGGGSGSLMNMFKSTFGASNGAGGAGGAAGGGGAGGGADGDPTDDPALDAEKIKGKFKCIVFAVGEVEYWVAPANGSAQELRDLAAGILAMLDHNSFSEPPSWWKARQDAAAATSATSSSSASSSSSKKRKHER